MNNYPQNQEKPFITTKAGQSEHYNENLSQSPYPQLNTYSEHSCYTDTLQSHQQPQQQPQQQLAKPDANVNADGNTIQQVHEVYFPVVYGAPVLPLNQIQPLEITTQPQIINPQIIYLKDLPFSEIKSQLVYVLLSFISWSVIEFFYVIGLFLLLETTSQIFSIVLFPVSLVMLYAFAKIGTLKKARQQPQAILIFLAEIFLTSQVLASFCFLFSNKRPPHEDGLYFTDAMVIFLFVLLQIIIDAGVSLMILFEILVGQNKILMFPTFIVIAVGSGIALFMFFGFIVNCALTLIQATMMFLALHQIQKGRYGIKQDEVFACTNALTFSFLFPFDLK